MIAQPIGFFRMPAAHGAAGARAPFVSAPFADAVPASNNRNNASPPRAGD